MAKCPDCTKKRSGRFVKRNKTKPIIYGARGSVRLEVQPEYLDELPYKYLGCYTKITKMWTRKHRTWFIDSRDLPGLVDKRYLFGIEEKPKPKTKKKKEIQPEVVELPEVVKEEVYSEEDII